MPNALAHEQSPYLRQHADNPVDWLPWGEPAFARARTEDKPIFLSIGYSTCHWCHVMAHESFANPETARLLNENFIAIKVDREERPDVDRLYMAYVQALTGQGGWPLSAWLTPDLKPFFGGTYFPPEDRQGRTGFPALLQALAKAWRADRARLVAEGERALGTLRDHYKGRGGGGGIHLHGERELVDVAGRAFGAVFQHFHESFDSVHGGFGGAPKFPRASNLNLLFRMTALHGAESEAGAEALRMATATLRAMTAGGIHDHVGGGYHRYAVDGAWFLPHFEKMLYDQAQIATNALEARQATGDERYAWMARDILDYALRDLRHPDGGFFTAEDADSARPAPGGDAPAEQAEGAFYVWTAAELRAALGSDHDLLAAHFGVEDGGNVQSDFDPHGDFRGRNILVQRRTLVETARASGRTVEQANATLLAGLERLREARRHRPRPHLDDKVLTATNGLMISALARAHAVLGPDAGGHLAAAKETAAFIERELHAADRGRLFRSWREGRGPTEGFAEDYAFLIQGLLDLYEASFDLHWLQWAEHLQATMDQLFWDGEQGGYFNSAAGDPGIVLRLKEDYDGAEPAPSSIAALNLFRLAALLEPAPADPTGDPAGTPPPGYRQRGLQCLEAFLPQWSGVPQAMPQMLCAVSAALEQPRHVVLAGDPADADFQALSTVLHEQPGPGRSIIALPGTPDDDPATNPERTWWVARAPWTAAMGPVDGRAAAYVCERFACQAPVNTPVRLREVLSPESPAG